MIRNFVCDFDDIDFLFSDFNKWFSIYMWVVFDNVGKMCLNVNIIVVYKCLLGCVWIDYNGD